MALPCMHTFCKKCARRLEQQRGDGKKKGGGTIRCPTCRRGATAFTPNYPLQEALELLRKGRKGSRWGSRWGTKWARCKAWVKRRRAARGSS